MRSSWDYSNGMKPIPQTSFPNSSNNITYQPPYPTHLPLRRDTVPKYVTNKLDYIDNRLEICASQLLNVLETLKSFQKDVMESIMSMHVDLLGKKCTNDGSNSSNSGKENTDISTQLSQNRTFTPVFTTEKKTSTKSSMQENSISDSESSPQAQSQHSSRKSSKRRHTKNELLKKKYKKLNAKIV